MSDEQKFLFQSDLKRFSELVRNDDSKARFAALETLDDLLLVEVIRYGVFNNQEMIAPLITLYRGPVMQMSEDRRSAVYEHVAGFVEHTSIVSVNAFLPFITEDNARLLVARAVIDYVSLGSLTDGDPMSRVKDIIRMIERNGLENEGAAFGALLHIGDKRVCDLLIPLRDNLDRDAMNNAVNSGTGFIHSATADFYLDWLEGMEGTDQDGAFGIVASGLGLLKKKSRIDQVATGHRPFPTRDATPEQWRSGGPSVDRCRWSMEIAHPSPTQGCASTLCARLLRSERAAGAGHMAQVHR